MKNPSTVATAFYLDTAKDKYGTEVMLPQMLGEVTKLEVGYVSGPKIGEVGDSLQYFTNLNRLVLSGHAFSTLDVSDLEKLTYLDVSDNRHLNSLKFYQPQLGYLNISRCSSLAFGTSRFGYNISDATIKSTPDIYFTKNEVGHGTDSVWRTFEKDDGSLWAEKWNGSWWYDTNNWDSEAPIDSFKDDSITAGGVLEARVEPSDVENEITGALITTSLTNFAENLLAVDIDRCPYEADTTLKLTKEDAGFFVSGVGIGLKEVHWGNETAEESYAATKFLNVHENDIIKTNLITGTKIHNVIDVRMWDNLLGLEEGWEDALKALGSSSLNDQRGTHHRVLQPLLDTLGYWLLMDITINTPKATTINLNNNYIRSGVKGGESAYRTDFLFLKPSTGRPFNWNFYSLDWESVSDIQECGHDKNHAPPKVDNRFDIVDHYEFPSAKFSVTMANNGNLHIEGNAISEKNRSGTSNIEVHDSRNKLTILYWKFHVSRGSFSNFPSGKHWWSGWLRYTSHHNGYETASISVGYFNVAAGGAVGNGGSWAWNPNFKGLLQNTLNKIP